MSETIQPATDEQIDYIDGLDYGSISWQFANELVARIRADAEQIQQLKTELVRLVNIAGEAIGTDLSLRNSSCVDVLVSRIETLRKELREERGARENTHYFNRD